MAEETETLSESNKLDRELSASVKDPGEDDIIREESEEKDDGEAEEEESSEEEETEEEESEEEQSSDEKEVDADTQNALALYKALQGERGADVLRGLAIRAGLIKADATTSEVPNADDFTEELKAAMGPDWDFIAEKMGPAAKRYFDRKVEEVRQEHIRLETSLELEKAWAKLSEETDGDINNYEKEIDSLSAKYIRGRTVPIRDYVRDLYKIASADKKSSKMVEKTIKKIEKNASDRLPRSSEVGESRVKKGVQFPNLDQSIKEALQELTLKPKSA